APVQPQAAARPLSEPPVTAVPRRRRRHVWLWGVSILALVAFVVAGVFMLPLLQDRLPLGWDGVQDAPVVAEPPPARAEPDPEREPAEIGPGGPVEYTFSADPGDVPAEADAVEAAPVAAPLVEPAESVGSAGLPDELPDEAPVDDKDPVLDLYGESGGEPITDPVAVTPEDDGNTGGFASEDVADLLDEVEKARQDAPPAARGPKPLPALEQASPDKAAVKEVVLAAEQTARRPRPGAPRARGGQRMLLVSFSGEQSELSAQAREVLAEVVRTMDGWPSSAARISTLADQPSDDDYTSGPARDRVSAVERYLLAQGLEQARLSVLVSGRPGPAEGGDADPARAHFVQIQIGPRAQ
ncbi:MAG: hypothetical protein R3228_12600, partial [Halioglobus sp.]|nr:hypothetical protein [Halioglobus sp.]